MWLWFLPRGHNGGLIAYLLRSNKPSGIDSYVAVQVVVSHTIYTPDSRVNPWSVRCAALPSYCHRRIVLHLGDLIPV